MFVQLVLAEEAFDGGHDRRGWGGGMSGEVVGEKVNPMQPRLYRHKVVQGLAL